MQDSHSKTRAASGPITAGKTRGQRAMWAAFGLFTVVFVAFLLREGGPGGMRWLPGCLFHNFTGLSCPGCGMTRAVHATLHGRFGEAFRFNPVGMILLPVAAVGVALEILSWVLGKPLPFRLRVGVAGAWILVGVVVGFWVMRNIPAWPFTLLAPP
ncbi:MAG: hypothetical protein RLZZ214_1515 [Verrucomicrobiota bacterium]|jgi:hypothetical protein